MREVTSAANMNVAAVNYHFRSKDGLAEELFDRLAERVNRRRLEELDRYLDGVRRAGAAPKLPPIVRSFIRPYVEPDSGPTGPLLAQLVLQHRLSPSAMTDRVYQRHFDPLARRYIEALAQAVPNIAEAEWYWRYTFMVSTVILTVTDLSSDNRLARLSGGAADATRGEDLERYLASFLGGGLTAKSVAPRARGHVMRFKP